MAYEYDAFISYRRTWRKWIRNAFLPSLTFYLNEELAGECLQGKVFVDENDIEEGAQWPAALAQAHSRARVLIPVLSRQFFQSDWCRVELGLMFDRASLTRAATPLVIPCVVHDGEHFPPEVAALQVKNLRNMAYPNIGADSPKKEELDVSISEWAPAIAKAVRGAPPHDAGWEAQATSAMSAAFAARYPVSESTPPVPRFVKSP
jgi:hypothetical protein